MKIIDESEMQKKTKTKQNKDKRVTQDIVKG